MRQLLDRIVLLGCFITTSLLAEGADVVVWDFDVLSTIGGYKTVINGSPAIIETSIGKAVEFTRSPDQILISGNPLGTATEWTIEAIIKPYAIGSESDLKEPRFFHIEDSTNNNKRITMEMRISTSDIWYFDGFVKSTKNNCTLANSSLTHPVDEWYNTTITYENGVFTTYINGEKELSDNVTYEVISDKGRVSLGCRLNEVNYFKGAIRKMIFTKAALAPEDFDESYLITSARKSVPLKPVSISRKTVAVLSLNNALLSGKTFTLTGKTITVDKNTPRISNGFFIGVVAK